MPPKGKTNNPKGKPKGIKNIKTLQWEALGESITSKHTERFNGILESADDKLFTELYLDILEYFKPKQQRTELTGKDGKDLNEPTQINFIVHKDGN